MHAARWPFEPLNLTRISRWAGRQQSTLPRVTPGLPVHSRWAHSWIQTPISHSHGDSLVSSWPWKPLSHSVVQRVSRKIWVLWTWCVHVHFEHILATFTHQSEHVHPESSLKRTERIHIQLCKAIPTHQDRGFVKKMKKMKKKNECCFETDATWVATHWH